MPARLVTGEEVNLAFDIELVKLPVNLIPVS
jgi:hypothetical protein